MGTRRRRPGPHDRLPDQKPVQLLYTPDIFVADIKSFSSEAKDKLWCPVRALKWYMNHTRSLRTDHQKLFITATLPFRPASQCTISRWIANRSVPGG